MAADFASRGDLENDSISYDVTVSPEAGSGANDVAAPGYLLPVSLALGLIGLFAARRRRIG